jgi:hypothetical protein
LASNVLASAKKSGTGCTSSDKIVEGFHNWDTLGMMQQLGAVPALAHA